MGSASALVASVVGARPQFIKAAVVSRALEHACVPELIVHTGQHYDYGMSELFFRELAIPQPCLNLGIGSAAHSRQTGAMLEVLEKAFLELEPAMVLVYGDTNSTLAGALAAVKLNIPVAHVEAGLRSFNMRMPEEINRLLSDKISSLLFCPTQTAVENLRCEGITEGVEMCGDVMYDAALFYAGRAPDLSETAAAGFDEKGFYLATVHRAENTDDGQRLLNIFGTLASLQRPVLLPMHPRTSNRLARTGFKPARSLHVVEPVGYLEMVTLERAARIIFTDSGGMQKEALFHGTPCVTLRDETEWVETVEAGWNVLAGADPLAITHAAERFEACNLDEPPSLYGDGDAGRRIARTVGGRVGTAGGEG